ncbi:DUF1800 family protein [Micromonospora sp. WMMA1998]|uniref:DUF1800 family protein n=1 Tax=Micromonospora sp. WMMA1998 TaxID=3015167 RepID=UPI00248BD787|nr:DUF1800 family protein [Micromonospora sp. WMMA1998]WBC17257.1 DUF1800 family protein [Micromonospora sp. WMMA1998]
MADLNVPPRRPRDDRGWDGYQHPHPDGYRDSAAPYAGGHPAPQSGAGPQWVGPNGFASAGHAPGGYAQPAAGGYAQPAAGGYAQPAGGYGPPPGPGLPSLDDDGDDAPRRGRRRALATLGGAAVVAGGAALALSPQIRGLFTDEAAGDATGTVTTDGTTARPSGQQPSTVRTYTEQNESYMGSRAGAALKRNAPAGGRLFGSPAAAAEATEVTVKTVLAKDPIRHLASRTTFGPTAKVMADIKRLGIDDWLRQQLEPEKIAPTKAELKLAELPSLKLSPTQLRDQREQLNERGVDPARETVDATIARQIWSDRQLFEVMVDFWNDFLHVAADFDGGENYRNAFDRDVIRKHALGNYPDMLVAANKHPALLLYLNQVDSRKDAINENLARENLELYSVGVDGGYTEKDVRQAAMLQTGRGVADGKYMFFADRHYVGKVKILGFAHANNSSDPKVADQVIDSYIRYIALHPSTAKYVAQNLATRFVSDTPPKSIVDRLAKAYTTNKGNIRPVLATLFSSSEFWAAVGQKVRRPMEYLVATYRSLGVGPDAAAGFEGDKRRTPFAQGLRQIQDKMRELGQYPMGKPTPDGYADVYLAWTSAGTMIDGWNEAGDLLGGWRKQFTYVKPEKLVAKPPATAGAYVDALAQKLVHQKLSAKEKKLLLAVAGATESTKVDATFNGAIAAVARTILASPQHHLR